MSMLQQLYIMKCSIHPSCHKNSMPRRCSTNSVQWTCYNGNIIPGHRIFIYSVSTCNEIVQILVCSVMMTNILVGDYQRCGEHCFCFHGRSEPSGRNDRRNRSNRIGWTITARICLQMVLCYSSSSYAEFLLFSVHNSQLHAWNPLFFFPTLGLSFFPFNFNITCHLHYLAHFYPENAGSMFFLNSGTHPPDYLSQSIKPPH